MSFFFIFVSSIAFKLLSFCCACLILSAPDVRPPGPFCYHVRAISQFDQDVRCPTRSDCGVIFLRAARHRALLLVFALPSFLPVATFCPSRKNSAGLVACPLRASPPISRVHSPAARWFATPAPSGAAPPSARLPHVGVRRLPRTLPTRRLHPRSAFRRLANGGVHHFIVSIVTLACRSRRSRAQRRRPSSLASFRPLRPADAVRSATACRQADLHYDAELRAGASICCCRGGEQSQVVPVPGPLVQHLGADVFCWVPPAADLCTEDSRCGGARSNYQHFFYTPGVYAAAGAFIRSAAAAPGSQRYTAFLRLAVPDIASNSAALRRPCRQRSSSTRVVLRV